MMKELREKVRTGIEAWPVAQRCAAGELPYIRALHRYFWPYVEPFPAMIEQGVKTLPRSARLQFYRGAIAAMHEEERDHTRLWQADAREIGANLIDVPMMWWIRELLATVKNSFGTWQFPAHLAATELIAEEVSALLARRSPLFLAALPSQVWSWGEAHLLPHSGPSHLDIDLELARSLSTEPIEDTVLRTCKKFGLAAHEIFYKVSHDQER